MKVWLIAKLSMSLGWRGWGGGVGGRCICIRVYIGSGE